jgi:Smg protein
VRWGAFFLRYIASMFEVLVYVYENYFTGNTCPEPAHLENKLNTVGFDADEIDDALHWLSGLQVATRGIQNAPSTPSQAESQPWLREPTPHSMRIYSSVEKNHLGARCLGFIAFLETNGALSAPMREVVVDRAMAAQGGPVSLDDLKVIVLMVFWSFGHEPDALILDELCDDACARTAH